MTEVASGNLNQEFRRPLRLHVKLRLARSDGAGCQQPPNQASEHEAARAVDKGLSASPVGSATIIIIIDFPVGAPGKAPAQPRFGWCIDQASVREETRPTRSRRMDVLTHPVRWRFFFPLSLLTWNVRVVLVGASGPVLRSAIPTSAPSCFSHGGAKGSPPASLQALLHPRRPSLFSSPLQTKVQPCEPIPASAAK